MSEPYRLSLSIPSADGTAWSGQSEAFHMIIADPNVMGGLPVFAGSRVPIEIVLSSLDAGADLEELKLSCPFLTPAHIEAAQAYELEHPGAGRRTSGSRTPSTWKVRSRRVVRRAPKE